MGHIEKIDVIRGETADCNGAGSAANIIKHKTASNKSHTEEDRSDGTPSESVDTSIKIGDVRIDLPLTLAGLDGSRAHKISCEEDVEKSSLLDPSDTDRNISVDDRPDVSPKCHKTLDRPSSS